MLTADQLKDPGSGGSAPNETVSIPVVASIGEDVDPIWVIAHALGESATSCHGMLLMTQVCRGWRNYILTVKDELYGAILPRSFPRSSLVSMMLETSNQVAHVSNEERYRRHLQAQLALQPHDDLVWENLGKMPLMDPSIACTMELWLDSHPVLFGGLSKADPDKQPDKDSSPLTGLLKEMHTKEQQFLKDLADTDSHIDMQTESLAEMYDAMNKHSGWDKVSVMIHASNGDEVVRLCRAAFLVAIHDRYVFGNSMKFPKLVLFPNGMICLPLHEDQEPEIRSHVADGVVGERVCIQGLKTAHQHNGKEGTVSQYLAESTRFRVALDTGEVLAVKNENMKLTMEARPDLSVRDTQYIMTFKLKSWENADFFAEVLENLPFRVVA